MLTPKSYAKDLENGVITKDLLGFVIYSFNKRAKNYRDKENDYKARLDRYDNSEKYREKKENMYRDKEYLLKFLNPKEIHRTINHKEFILTDIDDDSCYCGYEKIETFEKYNRYTEEYDCLARYKISDTFCDYYLFYELNNFSFHTPIDSDYFQKGDGMIRVVPKEIKEKYNLQIKDIGTLFNKGADIKEILSLNFCEKVVDAFKNNKLKLV